MISDNKEARTFDPKERIHEIYSLLQQGKAFEDLAQQYSEDKGSAQRGGKLTRFSRGDLRSKAFEEVAYSLQQPGAVSEPFQSEFGWHIIRLEERHALPTFVERRENIEKRVKQGERSKIVTSAVNSKIKEKYGFEEGEDFIGFFKNYLSDEVLNRRWKYDTIPASDNKVLFSIGSRDVYYNDFAQYIEERQRRIQIPASKEVLLHEMYNEFETKALKDYFQDQLEFENEEYAAVISEYRNGLLIFDLMERNVWDVAKNDSLGLEKFYENHKNNYTWKERVEAVIVNVNDAVLASQVRNALEEGESVQAVKERFDANEKAKILLSEGVYEIGHSKLPEQFTPSVGVSDIYAANGVYTILVVEKIIPPAVKKLDVVRGKVMSDYQNHLEEEWLQSLREKYTIEVNKKALKKIKKEFQS
jgi:peptidyl-prolyl cis-trans isomerase SurA